MQREVIKKYRHLTCFRMIIRNVAKVSQPRQAIQTVSLKIPEPHMKVLGINRIHKANWGVNLGYCSAKVRNIAQVPLNESAANRTVAGRYVLKVKRLMNAVKALTV